MRNEIPKCLFKDALILLFFPPPSDCIENGGFCCTGEKRFTVDGQEDPHPTYPDANDCQMFYICLNQLIPKRSACEEGLVFNTGTGICDIPENVPEW